MEKVKVGYFDCPGVTGNYSITGLGFKPRIIHFYGSKNDGLQTWYHSSQSFVDINGIQVCNSFTGNFSNTYRGDNQIRTDRCLYLFAGGGAVQVNASFVSMDDDGFTLKFINTNSIFRIRYQAIG